jgi:uncharacterized protein
MTGDMPRPEVDDPRTLERPDSALLRYYFVTSLFGFIFFPLIYLPLWFRYHTLRYRFDEEGVSMAYGRFFQKETYLTYRRIQDIQVTRGFLQRRFGLAVLELQTASGSSQSEMKIEGIRNPERLRDFLYERMRGAADEEDEGGGASRRDPSPNGPDTEDEALRLLREIRDGLHALGEGRGPR